jgi:hypothetical protein
MNRLNDLLNEYRMVKLIDDCGGVNRLHGLKRLIEENLSKNSVVCEIGSYAGKSSELFALYCKGVYCVDVFGEPDIENMFDNMLKNYDNIIKVKGLSEEMSKNYDNGYFDFVYIDANHDKLSVMNDIKYWIDKIKDDGFVGGHDYHYGSGGVYEAIKEIFNFEPIIYEDSSWIIKKSKISGQNF